MLLLLFVVVNDLLLLCAQSSFPLAVCTQGAGNLDAVFHRTALALHCNARLDTLASVAF
jgi:hypothetical protein